MVRLHQLHMGKNGMKSKVVLAVGAHPDDIDFGASGTIAKFAEEGADTYYLICTDGSRGSSDPKMTHKRLAEIRKKEQENAGKVLGIKKVFFLNHTDTQLVSDLTLKEDIVRIIRTVKPNIVITMDPTFFYSTEFGFVNHTDHRAAALATMDACFPLSRDRLTFLNHEKVEHLVDISKTFKKKIKVLEFHKSQFEDFKKIEKMMTGRAKMLGKTKKYKFAESFVRIKLF